MSSQQYRKLNNNDNFDEEPETFFETAGLKGKQQQINDLPTATLIEMCKLDYQWPDEQTSFNRMRKNLPSNPKQQTPKVITLKCPLAKMFGCKKFKCCRND